MKADGYIRKNQRQYVCFLCHLKGHNSAHCEPRQMFEEDVLEREGQEDCIKYVETIGIDKWLLTYSMMIFLER